MYDMIFRHAGVLNLLEDRKMVNDNTINQIIEDKDDKPKTSLERFLKRIDDPINPNHYKIDGKFESFDFQQAVCKRLPGNEGSLVFNILKYVTRYKFKNGVEDLKKAQWYLNKLIELQNKE